MGEERKEINHWTLDLIEINNVDEIQIRSIGLLDVFGKMEIDIYYKNSSVQKLVAYSPVNVQQITHWLERTKLYRKTKYYEF